MRYSEFQRVLTSRTTVWTVMPETWKDPLKSIYVVLLWLLLSDWWYWNNEAYFLTHKSLLLRYHVLHNGRSLDPHNTVLNPRRPLGDSLDGVDLLCTEVKSVRTASKLSDLELTCSHFHISCVINCHGCDFFSNTKLFKHFSYLFILNWTALWLKYCLGWEYFLL